MGIASAAILSGNLEVNAVSHAVGMSASIDGVCSIGPVNSANGFTSSAGTALVATAGTNGFAASKVANLTLPYNCSSTGVTFKLTSDNKGITKPGTVPNGQTNKIHYTARIIEGSVERLAINTSTYTAPVTFNHLTSVSSLTLEIQITPGTALLVPGSDYADTLHLDIDANP